MKRLFIIILALTMAASLTACGETSNSTTSKDDTITAQSSADMSKDTTADFLKTITAETAEAKGVCGADLTWYYKDNVLVIKGTGDMTDWGTGLNGSKHDQPWYSDGIAQQISHVYIEDGVTSIGEYAFYECASISKIVIGKDVTSIGRYAFSGANSLSNVIVGESVYTIGYSAFSAEGVEFEFKGKAPKDEEGDIDYILGGIQGEPDVAKTIKYSDSSFDSYVEDYPEIEWIKQ